ncbi:MAG: hypothetical protein K6U04_11295 [Armatimonadetes bacterium]|nr:hypothetical protein [Armatimonadota bacterium]
MPQLIPVVSPAVALGRYLKLRLGPAAKVVFIGPCVAKKEEVRQEEVAGGRQYGAVIYSGAGPGKYHRALLF